MCIFQTQANGVWSQLLKQCQQSIHQEVTKLSSLWITVMRNLLIWSHLHIALSQSATHSTLFWRQRADSLHLSSQQHLLSDSKDTVCYQHLLAISLAVRGNADLALSSRRAQGSRPWKGTLLCTSTPGAGRLLCSPRIARVKDSPKALEIS